MRILRSVSILASVFLVTTAGGQPQYQIFDIGVVQPGDTASQGFGVSLAGVAVGRSFQSSGTQAFTWTQGGGIVGLPNIAGRSYGRSNSANDSGIVVGTGSTTAFGSNRLPLIWQNGSVSQLPLPSGETIGDANSVNSLGIAVGSVDGGSLQQGAIYKGASSAIITETTSTGCTFVTAFGINDSGRIVGFGIDPNNAARNVGIVLDFGDAQAFEVGALPGFNGALAFAVSNTGYVVGSSMLNQGSGLPFIWSAANGMVAIPLATGTSQGSARGVNSAGWVVGDDSSAFSIPFLWDGTTTYRIADLLPPNSGWDLSMNTSSSALGISNNGIIVGTGVHNGDTHGYAMVPVTASPTPSPTPTPTATPTPSPISFDFGIVNTDSPDPVEINHDLTYTITVTNHSPGASDNELMRDILPPGVDFVSVTPSQGTCSGTTMIGCLLESIPGGGSATVILVVRPTATGMLSNTAEVIYPDDPNPSNNTSTAVTTVIPAGGASPTPTPSPTPTNTPTPTPAAAQALNVSTRLRVLTDANVGIGGFIITGTEPKQVLLRGIGPSLPVPDPLADPVLELRGPNGLIITNDNWKDGNCMLDGLPPTNPLEACIDATLDPGTYTAILKGKNNGTGVGLVELYDVSAAANSKLGNISTRGFVGTGSDIMIAGIILGNGGETNVVVRGIGPSLTPLGVPNALGNPQLELRDSTGTLIRSDNDWMDDPAQKVLIMEAGLAPGNNLESAIYETLGPGQYTALLSGVSNGTGVGLVEAYDLASP